MSDRPQGSVRTGTRDDGAAAAPAAPEAAPATGETRVEEPVSTTQSIPTGQNRVVQPGRPASAAVPPPATGERPVGTSTGSSRTVAAGAAATTTAPPGAATGTAPKAPGASAPAKAPVKAAGKAASKAAAAITGGMAAARKPVKGGRGPRRARLQLRHIDTWSAFKISFVLSVALFFIWMVAVGVLYGVLSGLGVFVTLNELFGQLSASAGGDVITPGVVFGAAAVIGAVNIILLTALGTISTFIYNLCSDLVGGLEVTLSERD
jgi:Transmembrane domain of unknown function (DUF3566)